MNFKDNLKRIREDRNLTQDDIAREIGISRQSVSKWENGVAEPDLETISKLCIILNCSLEDLVNGEQPTEKKKKVLTDIERAKRNNDIGMAILIVLIFIFVGALVVFLCYYISDWVAYNRAITSEGMDSSIGLTGRFLATELQGCAERLAIKTYGESVVDANPDLIVATKSAILGQYSLSGNYYWYKITGPVTIHHWLLVVSIGLSLFITPMVILLRTTIKNNKKYLKELNEGEKNR